MAVFERGPYIRLAALCEKVLQEQDGVISLIRVVDRITHTALGPDAPAELQPFVFPLTLVLSLTAGEALGSCEVSIRLNPPSGIVKDLPPARLFLEGGERATNFIARLEITFEHEGLYWFEVMFERQLLTRLPLRIIYSRLG